MSAEANNKVDANVELAILQTIEKKLDKFSAEIIDHLDLKIKPVSDQVFRNTDRIDDLSGRVLQLEKQQTADEIIRAERDNGESRNNRKTELTWLKVGGIAGLAAAAGGLLVFFIK